MDNLYETLVLRTADGGLRIDCGFNSAIRNCLDPAMTSPVFSGPMNSVPYLGSFNSGVLASPQQTTSWTDHAQPI